MASVPGTIADALRCPVEVVITLVKNPNEAAALLDAGALGQRLEDLLGLQSTQRECDVSSLQKVCTALLSSKDGTLLAFVAQLMSSAAATTRAADATQEKISQIVTALESIASKLERHAELNSAVATELRRQATCQELAIERELLARIQAELARRSANVARVRGHIAFSPFHEALNALKAEAMAKMQLMIRRRHDATARELRAIVPAPAKPSTSNDDIDALRNEVRSLNRGMHAMAAQMQQLMDHQRLGKALEEHDSGALGPRDRCLQVQEVSPGIPRHPAPVLQIDMKKSSPFADEPARHQRTKEAFQEHGPQSKALRGDAAPSTSTEGGHRVSAPASQPRGSQEGPARGDMLTLIPQQEVPQNVSAFRLPPPTAGPPLPQQQPHIMQEKLNLEEKENIDATQSQGNGTQNDEGLPLTQPSGGDCAVDQEPCGKAPSQPALVAKPRLVGTLKPWSQIDSTSPGSIREASDTGGTIAGGSGNRTEGKIPPGRFLPMQEVLPNVEERKSEELYNGENDQISPARDATTRPEKRARPASDLFRGTEREDTERGETGLLKKRQRRGGTPWVEKPTDPTDTHPPGRATPSFLAWDPTPWQDDGDGKGSTREVTTARTPFTNLSEGEEDAPGEHRAMASLPPPSTVRVAGAAKGATPMFVSLPVPGSTPVGTCASLRGRHTPATSWLNMGKASGRQSNERGTGLDSPCKASNEEEKGVDDHPDDT